MSDLARFIERVKNLVAEKIGLDEDIKEVLDEADEAGFDKAIIRKVATIAAKQSALKIAKERAKLDEYAAQIGLDFDMPTGIPGGKKDHERAAPRAAGDAAASGSSAAVVATRPEKEPASPDPSPSLQRAAKRFVNSLGPGDSLSIREPDGTNTLIVGKDKDGNVVTGDEPPDIPPFLDRRAKSGQAAAE